MMSLPGALMSVGRSGAAKSCCISVMEIDKAGGEAHNRIY